jgi:hypothetical protein
MATLIFDSLTDHSPLDGTNDAINGAEVDANPNVVAKVLDGTTATDAATDSTVDFRFTSSRAGLRLIDLDNAAGSVHYALDIEWDPGDGAQMTDGSSGVGLRFLMPDAADTQTIYARIYALMRDDTAASDDADIVFETAVDGTLTTEILRFGGGGSLVYNEDSADLDARFESNGLSHALFIDGGKDALVFGANSDVSSTDTPFLIDYDTRSATADTNFDRFKVGSSNAITVPSGTTALVTGAHFAEPNITATGTVTSASTVYIAAAPSEGGTNNYALWVDAGAVQFDAGLTVGTDVSVGDDLLLTSSGAVINFNSGDVTLTHSSNTLTVAGGTLATAALTASTVTASGIVKTDDATDATSTTDGSLQTDGGLSVVKDAVFGNDVKLLSDSAVLSLGAGNDATLTHDGTTGVTIAANPITITSATAATWSTSAGALTLNGTGGVAIQEGGSTIIGISDARVLATTNTASVDLDATGAIQVNSSGGAISIANDNVDQTVNLATAGTRTLNIGILDGTDTTTITSKGNQTHSGTVTVGANTDGYDVKLFGNASGAYMLWDESEDDLKLVGAAGLTVAGTSALTVTTASSITGSGVLSIDDTTESTSTTTGSIHTDGGVGIAKDLILGATSTIFIGDTANANMVTGITINQGADDDEVLAFKASEVAHGITDQAETDTYGVFDKAQAVAGGLRILGLSDAHGAAGLSLTLDGMLGEAADTKKATDAVGVVQSRSYILSGTNVAGVGADGNIFCMSTASTTRFIFDKEGSGHADVEWVAFSDQRLKSNAAPCPYGIDAVVALTPRIFDKESAYIEGGQVILEGNKRRMLGFYAQDVIAQMPELVKQVDTSHSFYSLDYGRFTPVLWKAVQELHARLEAAERSIAA